jgi:hypothetical protein
MPHGRMRALTVALLLLIMCAGTTPAQRRRPPRAPEQPRPTSQSDTERVNTGFDSYWEAQRSIEAAISQLEAYLRASPDGERAATAHRQLDTLRSLTASAALPEWVRMRDLPLSEVPEWRVASVVTLMGATRVVIEIACRRQDGHDCYFRPFDRSPLVLIDDSGGHNPMLDAGELPADVRREEREGLAAISGGRTVSVTVGFAPLARGATGGQVYYRDRNEAVPARFRLAGRR